MNFVKKLLALITIVSIGTETYTHAAEQPMRYLPGAVRITPFMGEEEYYTYLQTADQEMRQYPVLFKTLKDYLANLGKRITAKLSVTAPDLRLLLEKGWKETKDKMATLIVQTKECFTKLEAGGLQEEADIRRWNPVLYFNALNDNKESLLMVAVRKQNKNAVRYIVGRLKASNPDLINYAPQGEGRKTALDLALATGNKEIVNLLKRSGARPAASLPLP